MFTVVVPKVVTKPTKLLDKKTGEIRIEQLVMVSHPEQFTPVQTSILLDSGQKPYEVGSYALGWDSITPGEYGRAAFRVVVGARLDVKKVA